MRAVPLEPSEVRDRALAAIAEIEPCDTAMLAQALGWTVRVANQVVAVLLRFGRVEARPTPAGLTGDYVDIRLTEKGRTLLG